MIVMRYDPKQVIRLNETEIHTMLRLNILISDGRPFLEGSYLSFVWCMRCFLCLADIYNP